MNSRLAWVWAGLSLGWLEFGLAWVWAGLRLGWLEVGLAWGWAGLSLGWLESGLAWVWAGLSLGWLEFGLAWVWAGLRLGWLEFGLAWGWAGLSLGWLEFGLAWVWAGLSLGWVEFGLAWVWAGLSLGWLEVGLAWGWAGLSLGWLEFGLAWVWAGLRLGWLEVGLAWVWAGLRLGWLEVGLAWVWAGLRLGWLEVGLAWVWAGLSLGWLEFGLAWGWVGLRLGWLEFGLAWGWAGLSLGWLEVGLAWVWAGLSLGWLEFGLAWGWAGLSLGWLEVGLAWGWAGLRLGWLEVGLAWVWAGLSLGWLEFGLAWVWAGQFLWIVKAKLCIVGGWCYGGPNVTCGAFAVCGFVSAEVCWILMALWKFLIGCCCGSAAFWPGYFDTRVILCRSVLCFWPCLCPWICMTNLKRGIGWPAGIGGWKALVSDRMLFLSSSLLYSKGKDFDWMLVGGFCGLNGFLMGFPLGSDFLQQIFWWCSSGSAVHILYFDLRVYVYAAKRDLWVPVWQGWQRLGAQLWWVHLYGSEGESALGVTWLVFLTNWGRCFFLSPACSGWSNFWALVGHHVCGSGSAVWPGFGIWMRSGLSFLSFGLFLIRDSPVVVAQLYVCKIQNLIGMLTHNSLVRSM